jgi:hypothetical protein
VLEAPGLLEALQGPLVHLLGLDELALVSIEVPEVVEYVELLDRIGRCQFRIGQCGRVPASI